MATHCNVPYSVATCAVRDMAACLHPRVPGVGQTVAPLERGRGACAVEAVSGTAPGLRPGGGRCQVRPPPGLASAGGAVLGGGHLGKPGDRVAAEGLVDRHKPGIVLVVQRAEVDADHDVAVVEGRDVAAAGGAEAALGLARERV